MYADCVWALLINHNHINVRKRIGQTDRWTDRSFVLTAVDVASVIVEQCFEQ